MQDKPNCVTTIARCLAAATLLVAPLHVAQAQKTLKIQRGAGGAVLQEIEISSARYSGKVRQLIVNSVSGSRVCGGMQSKAAGVGGTLVLDGRSYAIDEHDFSSSKKVINVWPQQGVGLFPLCVNQVAAKGSDPIKLSVNVEANADAGGPAGRASVDVLDSTVDYTLSDGRLTLPLAEDVLCLNVGTGSGEPTLNLIDTNGQSSEFLGISDLAFYPFGGPFGTNSLVLNTSPDLVCVGLSSVGPKGGAQFDQECPLVPIPAPIFYGGFGDDRVEPPPDLAPGIDLQVNVELDQNPTLPQPFGTEEQGIYRVQVRNCGKQTATAVSVRDFWRPEDAATEPRFEQSSTWTCPACQSGGSNGSSYIDAQQQTLASQQSIEFTATRALSSEATVLEDQVIELTVAAFAGPGDEPEYGASDNTMSVDIPVLRTNNTPPTVTANLPPEGYFRFDERDPVAEGLPPLIELIGAVTASDVDDGLFGEIVDVDVSYDRADIFSASGALIKNGDEITITLRPIGDAFGTATVSVVAIDGAGDPSAPVEFDVWMQRINDAPTFSVNQFDPGMPGFVDPGLPACEPEGSPGTGCADQSWVLGALPNNGNIVIDGWIADQSSGPPNESDELTYETISVVDPDGIFIGPGFYPTVDGKGNLRYGLIDDSDADPVTGTATIQIVVRDNGGTARGGEDTSEVLEFEVSVQ